MRDAHRQHAKHERLLRGAVDARTTTAQHRLDNLSHDLASSGYMTHMLSEGSSYQDEDAMDKHQSLGHVFAGHSDGLAIEPVTPRVEKVRREATANATFTSGDTLTSTAELMELVDLVSKEF